MRGGGTGRAEAIAIWDDLWRRNRHDLRAARALAVALVKQRRLAEALAVAELALEVCAATPDWRLSRLRGAPATGWEAEWRRRRERLEARLRRDPAAGRAQSPEGAPLPGPLVTPPLFAY
jgi:hypothetical protein